MPQHDKLDGVRDDFPRHEGGPHPFRAHGDPVGDGDGVELEGGTARGPNSLLHARAELPQVDVAGRDVTPRIGDPDEGSVQILVGQT